MIATGIVRRCDDLGRVNIPKEIRRKFNITEGTPIEIFTDKDDIILRKYTEESDDMCEWKVFDNSLTDEPQWVYKTTCGKYIGEEHTSKAFVYCPYCGKKIKVVE